MNASQFVCSKPFDEFAELVLDLPDGLILKALDFKHKLLKDDLCTVSDITDETYSVLYFLLFVRAAKLGQPMHLIVPLPKDHIKFYRKTIFRLVKARQLSSSAMDYFDNTFVVEI